LSLRVLEATPSQPRIESVIIREVCPISPSGQLRDVNRLGSRPARSDDLAEGGFPSAHQTRRVPTPPSPSIAFFANPPRAHRAPLVPLHLARCDEHEYRLTGRPRSRFRSRGSRASGSQRKNLEPRHLRPAFDLRQEASSETSGGPIIDQQPCSSVARREALTSPMRVVLNRIPVRRGLTASFGDPTPPPLGAIEPHLITW